MVYLEHHFHPALSQHPVSIMKPRIVDQHVQMPMPLEDQGCSLPDIFQSRKIRLDHFNLASLILLKLGLDCHRFLKIAANEDKGCPTPGKLPGCLMPYPGGRPGDHANAAIHARL